MTQAYSYVRFSTPEQSKGDSFRRQARMAEEYASSHGLDLDTALVYQDRGKSAYRSANVETGRLGAFLEAVKAGEVERGSYLLVESLDRISRDSALDAVVLLRDICAAGDITVVTLMDRQEYTRDKLRHDTSALLMSMVTFIRAHDESRTKGLRVRSAWEAKRKRAKEEPLTKVCPAWLRLTADGKRFELIPERAAIVKRIYKLSLAGMGQHKIAVTLNDAKVQPFGRAKSWQRSYVVKILSNPAVVGDMTPHLLDYSEDRKRIRKPLKVVRAYFPPAVSKEVFQRAQALRSTRNPLRGRHAGGEVRNIFGGLARCPKCHGTMTRVYKGEDGGSPRLVCAKAKVGGGCTYKAIRYDELEAAFLRDGAIRAGAVPTGDEGKREQRELENVEAGMGSLDAVMERLVKAIKRGGSTRLTTELAEAERTKGELVAQRTALLSRLADVARAAVSRKAAELASAVKASPLHRGTVNALLRQLLDSAEVDYENVTLRLNWKHGGQSEVVYAWPGEVERPRRTRKRDAR